MTPEERLTQAYLTAYAAEAARDLELMPPGAATAVLAQLPSGAVAEALRHLVPYAGARVLERLAPEQGAAALAALSASEALGLLRSIEPTARGPLLGALPGAHAMALERMLTYPAHTAGALADPFVLTGSSAATVAQTLERVRREQARAIYYVYVLETGARLVGVTTLKLLLATPPDASLASVARHPVATLPAQASVEAIGRSPHWRAHHILPVVEQGEVFVGALRLRTLHGLQEARRGVAADSLAASLVELWELYAMAGLGLMTGVATGLDAAAAAVSPARPASSAPHEEGS